MSYFFVLKFPAASLQEGKRAGSPTDQHLWFREELNVLTRTLPSGKVSKQYFYYFHFPKYILLGC